MRRERFPGTLIYLQLLPNSILLFIAHRKFGPLQERIGCSEHTKVMKSLLDILNVIFFTVVEINLVLYSFIKKITLRIRFCLHAYLFNAREQLERMFQCSDLSAFTYTIL